MTPKAKADKALTATRERLMSLAVTLPSIGDIDRLRVQARDRGDSVTENMCVHALGFAGYGRLAIQRK